MLLLFAFPHVVPNLCVVFFFFSAGEFKKILKVSLFVT